MARVSQRSHVERLIKTIGASTPHQVTIFASERSGAGELEYLHKAKRANISPQILDPSSPDFGKFLPIDGIDT